MFDGSADALALYAFDVTNRNARGEKRVFTEVLKVSTIHRSTVDVYSGCQEKVYPFGARVTSELSPDKLGQRRIPGSSQRNASGKRGSWSKIAHADGPVSHLQSRQVETRNVANEKTVDAAEQGKFFVERHLVKDSVNPALDLNRSK